MTEPRNAQNWAKPIEVFHIDETIEGVGKGKVEGRKPTAPLHGFGRLWQQVVRGHQKVTSGRPSSHSALMKPRGRIDLMVRANDPLYEVSFYTSRLEDKIWTHMLTELAATYGSKALVSQRTALVDRRRQWREWCKCGRTARSGPFCVATVADSQTEENGPPDWGARSLALS